MKSFSQDFQNDLARLLRWRRDVRRFRTQPVGETLLQECLNSFLNAPSVGLSEPWRIVHVKSPACRTAAYENFKTANAQALDGYEDEKSKKYANLKLSGMSEAPVQLAIYCDEETPKGSGLGAATMPEMRRYSVVGAINLFWLTARAKGLGVGWVSILDPVQLSHDLQVPKTWRLVAYLCVGWPETVSKTPELEELGWEDRRNHLPVETR